MKKRLISIAVVLSIVASLFTFNIYSKAATSYVSPNVAILENILYGDRQFVLDTLIGTNYKTDFSTNPHALVNYIGNENTMMDNVLSQFQNKDDPLYNPAYKAAVDIMEKIYNGDDYIQHAADWVTAFAADLLSIFSSDAQRVMDDLTYSVSQIQYESILKEALAADYTSSNGTELSTTELELQNLKRLNDAVSCLKAFQAFAFSYGKANHYDEKDEDFRNAYDYYTQYLTSYSDSIEKALGSFSKVMNLGDTEDIASFIAFMGTVAQYDLHCAELEAFDSEIPQYAAEYFVSSEELEKMKFDKSVISGVSNALSSYMFINSIALQRDAIGDTLMRMSNTANPSLRPILMKFANEVGKAGDAKLMGYESLMKVLRDENATVDFAKWGTKKLSEKSSIIKTFKKKALTDTALSKAISGATNVVNISSWCADKTMSFGDTCKKTYELKYLKTLIAQAICTYEDDLDVYLANKTDENARIVLDDLLMIQKLRLRGETIAYKMTEGQWKSPLGKLLATGTLAEDKMLMEYLTQSYQSRVDAFIGASAMPFTTDSLTVKNGETLTINYNESYGGLYATYRKADGTEYGIGELKYRIANGLTVGNGGTIRTISNGLNASIPYIENNGGAVQLLGNIKLLEYSQNSGTTTLGAFNYPIGDAYFSGGTIETNNNGTLTCENFSVSGTVTANLPITCTNNMHLSGSVIGNTVYLKGNSSGSGTLDNIVVSGSGTQSLSGTINTTNLTYSNTGTANQTGTFNVSGSVQNISSKVTNGQNTVLKSTGSIIGNHYNSGLTIDGIVLDKGMTFGGTLKILNDVTLEDVNIKGGLTQSSGNLNLNGDVTVTGDSYFGGMVAHSGTTYSFGGDIIVTGSNTFNGIVTQGKLQQNITGTLNTSNFTNTNPKGVKISNTVNVSGILTNSYGKISGMGMILLPGGGFGSDTYQGDVTIKSSCNLPSKLTGNVVVSADNTIKQDTEIDGYLTVSSGNLTLENAKLNVDGKFTLSVPLASEGTGYLTCNSVLENSSTINNCHVTTNKELINSGTLSGGSITALNDIYNNGTIDIDDLSLKSMSLTEVSGNSIATNNFTMDGTGKISLKTNINVAHTYTNNGVKVDENKIIISSGRVITSDKTYPILNQTTALIIDGCTVTVDIANITSGIKLINGANLIINKRLTANASSNTIEIDETSALTVKKIASISSYSGIMVNGELTLGSDAVMNSTKLNGSGTINIKGDLYGNSLTLNNPKNVNIIGKTPQIISCSGANFNNLYISNNSHGGVKFSSSVNCYGKYNPNNSNVSGTVTQK